MKESEILNLAKSEPDWEEILKWIITEEGIDPWDIDIVELAEAFNEFIEKWDQFNFSMPARLIIVMTILLRIKVEILMWEDEGQSKDVDDVEIEELDIDVSDIPFMEAPKKRMPTRKVTMDELVSAFKKAFETKERRNERKRKARKRVKEAIKVNETDEEDIDQRIDKLYSRITGLLEEMKSGETTFSSLLPTWSREEIIRNFFPLLLLHQKGTIIAEQEEFFDEIKVILNEQSKN